MRRVHMIEAISLTFVVTVLCGTVLVLWNENRRSIRNNFRLSNENDELRRRISDYETREQQIHEKEAYEHGLHDGRQTDALYRQCLKKYMNQDQARVMLNGEEGDR